MLRFVLTFRASSVMDELASDDLFGLLMTITTAAHAAGKEIP